MREAQRARACCGGAGVSGPDTITQPAAAAASDSRAMLAPGHRRLGGSSLDISASVAASRPTVQGCLRAAVAEPDDARAPAVGAANFGFFEILKNFEEKNPKTLAFLTTFFAKNLPQNVSFSETSLENSHF